MDQFEAYFRRADLDRDGRISGTEAVAFFQGSNLPKPVLAQIWQHADQNHTGFLGRPEFYNALKLVTVAQSKRELTPDIVKAALYGPASAKIPAPQINLAAIPGAQPNSMAPRPPTQQPGAVASMGPQNFGVRGQGPPNSMASPSMAPPSSMQNFTSQGNQSVRPPLTGYRPQAVGGPNHMRGSGPVVPSNSNVSNDWFAGRSVGTPSAPTSQVPIRPVSSIAPNIPTGGSLVGPSPSTAPRTSVGGSDPMFGGDVFSTSQSVTRLSSSPMPTNSSSNAPASTATVPVTSEPQTPAKIDPLGALNAFTRGPTGAQVQSSMPSVPRPNQQGPTQNISSFGPSGVSAEAKNPAPNQSQPQWPKMTRAGVTKYMKVFMEVDTDRDGKITGEQARNLFLSWRLPREILKQVWDLSDQDNDSMLSVREFCIALYLMERYREGHNLPPTLPSNILLDETLLTLTGPPNPSYASAGWGATPGFRPQQGMSGAQQMPHAGLRPQMQGAYPRADGQMQYNQQMGLVSSVDNSHASKLSNGEQNSFDSHSQETTDTEKEVEDKKVILDSREKMEFYRNRMQDLVLYKSRCDNRLNEIEARALGDKREAELLAKKYEERYKQVAEVASKLTIEEASFRDIQERKTELNQALLKMEQGGSADGILQVRADRIQSDLEELLKALAERCKKHGINVKSTAIIELPQGWQPGVPEICAVWDEEWDKFEDEGFSFDVALPPNAKSTSPQGEKSSLNDDFSPDSLSNVDHEKSEKPFDHALDIESAYSEDESTRSPASSPPRQKIFESPTKEDSDSHFGKSFDADTETNRSFDESGWGTFDNTDDVDSVWGFNNDTTKENEKHGENYFFESGGFGVSPRKTDSPQADSFFQKKSPFGFDDSVPGSPASRAGTSPRYSGGGPENSFFDSFSRYDSFATNDRGSPKRETFSRFDSMSSTTQDHNFSTFDSGQDRNFSRFDSMSSTTQDRNFTRFDSINSSVGFDHSQTYSFDDSDPFGSSGPFKVSSESQPEKKDTDKWAF